VRARGPQAAEQPAALAIVSTAAKRAYFATNTQPHRSLLSWHQHELPGDRDAAKSAGPETVRVRCGNKIHRLRLYADGGPAVLLDHPHLDRKAEQALIALGAPRPDCLLMLDAIAGRVSPRRILWRRRVYPIAARGAARRRCRQRGPIPTLERPLAERYAEFVRHRAALLLDRLLPAGTSFRVLVIPPPSLHVEPPFGILWSWRRRPGMRLTAWGTNVEVHIPFDWQVVVEKAHATRLQSGFIVDARADRHGQMLHRLDFGVTRLTSYGACRGAWRKRIEAIDSSDPVPPRRWQRARRPCLIALPDRCRIISKGVHDR
jgi:hypothetical protein